MANTVLPSNSLKSIQDAWLHLLLRFKSWYFPESILTKDWKERPALKAIRSCKARLMDDSEGMLADFSKNKNDPNKTEGSSAYLPIMLTATAAVDMPPDLSQLIGVPYFVSGEKDGKEIRIRVIPSAVRCQIAFYSSNSNDTRSVCQQFCAFLNDDNMRRIDVEFEIGVGIKDTFRFTVFENNLLPSAVPVEASNLSIATVDVTLVGYIPQVIGLGAVGEDKISTGYDNQGRPNETAKDGMNGEVVVQADQYDEHHTRIIADKETGKVTIEKIEGNSHG